MAIKIADNFNLQEKLQYTEELLKQILELLSKATSHSDKKRFNILAGTNLGDLGFINILLKNFGEAKSKFKQANKYQKTIIKVKNINDNY